MTNKAPHKLTREERKTSILTSDADDKWSIFTASPKFIRRFERLGYRKTKTDAWGGCFYEAPLHAIRFGKPQKRTMSDSQRAALARARLSTQESLCLQEN